MVVESVNFLLPLRQIFPDAKIYSVVSDDDVKFNPDFNDLGVEFHILDYRQERLPFKGEFFDAIIGDLTLEVVNNPQDIAAGFSTYLKQTGVWITSFKNIRHWSIIKKLMAGHFGGIVSRFYTKADFKTLCYASFYKDVMMMPVIKRAPEELIKKLVDCGFENINDDLETEIWLVRAARSMPELALLKSMYTPEDRKELSKILHRIEYEIETQKSIDKFWQLYDKMRLFPDYVVEFINSTVFHHRQFYRLLTYYSRGRSELYDILDVKDMMEYK